MSIFLDAVRAFDAHPPRRTEQKARGTLHGGCCTFLVIVLFLAFVANYLLGVPAFGGTYSLVATTKILPFPYTASKADKHILPPITCIAPAGCWVRSQVVISDSDPTRCMYIAPYESFPSVARNIYLESDPTDSLTVLWEDQTNFGISYDFLEITDSLRGQSALTRRSTAAPSTSDADTKKVAPGSALFMMTRATRAGGALAFHLEERFDLTSWQHISMTTEGTTTAVVGGAGGSPGGTISVPVGYSSNLCCGATEVFTHDLEKTSDAAALAGDSCEGLTSLRIIPFTTFTETEVHPWALEFLYSIGGVLELMIYTLLCFVLFFRCFLKPDAHDDDDAQDKETGDLEIAALPGKGAEGRSGLSRSSGTRM